MTTRIIFNAQTLYWTLTSGGIINYSHASNAVHGTTTHTSGPYPSAEYVAVAVKVPFDPIHETGGSFYKPVDGPYAGKYFSAWSNTLGYGDITILNDEGDYVPPASPSYPKVNPLADWRILIKGMGGAIGPPTPRTVTINQPTNVYSLTSGGIIDCSNLPNNAFPKIAAGGTYKVVQVTVPYDPIHKTGGSFYQLVDGPSAGKLISKWTNTLSDDFGSYGNITVTSAPGFNR